MSQNIVLSAAPAFLANAGAQVLEQFPGAWVEPVSEDSAVVSNVDLEGLVRVARSGSLGFVRHLASVAAEVPLGDEADFVAEVLAAVGAGSQREEAVALQVWASGPGTVKAESRRRDVADLLDTNGVRHVRSGAPLVLGVHLCADTEYITWTPVELSLSDWPGGRVRLAKPRKQVSRAEFKLEELVKHRGPLGTGGTAIDLGASPGGWTRLLASWGYSVLAVDPAELAPALRQHPNVEHRAQTVEAFLASGEVPGDVDLLVSDMRMDGHEAAGALNELAPRLGREGLLVTTVKLASKQPLGELDAALSALSDAYRLDFVRQLFHNRSEVTVVARPR